MPRPLATTTTDNIILFDTTGKQLVTRDEQNASKDMYKALDVLAKDVKLIGLFSDWPATVSYYASCMGLD